MMGSNYKWLIALLVSAFFLSGEVRGQSLRTNDYGRGDLSGIDGQQQVGPGIGSNPFENPDEMNEEGNEPADTVKKIRKPLESWFFDDSTRAQPNFAWNVDMYTNNVHMTAIDTTLNNFQNSFPFQRHDVGDAYQGNLGGASVPLSFFRRPDFQDFSFLNPYYSYLMTSENAPYYNVKKPFTQLGYITAGNRKKAEENFSVIHAQNITPSTGFNITYHTRGTRGMYRNQRTRNTDFSAAVSHTGKRYSAHGGYIFNTFDVRDNGGVVDWWHIDHNETYSDSRNIPVWLDANTNNAYGARNLYKNNTFYTIHSYGVPLRRLTEDDFSMSDVPAFYVGYAFQYDRWSRRYTDLREYAGSKYAGGTEENFPDHEYYKDWFMNGKETRDSLFESRLSNRVFIQLQPWDRDGVVGTVDAGVGMDMHNYYMFNPEDYVTGGYNNDKRNSYYVYGSVEGKIRKYFDWSGKVNIVPFGYKEGDLNVEANARVNVFFRGKPVSLSGKLFYNRSEAPYWSQTYFSNHFKWSNSFSKENETRFQVNLAVPAINAEVSFHQSVVKDKVFYVAYGGDTQDIRPRQHGDAVSLTGLDIRKDFRVGGFHFNNRVLLQWSTEQIVVPVPLVSVYLSWFFEFPIVRNVLHSNVGIDFRYNTRYYGYGYNPAVSQFYTQQNVQMGGYPMIDVYWNFKWKRMRIYVKLEHATEDLFNTRDYYMVMNYPLNKRMLRYGVSWSFYN